ncbi:MAG: MFS transporter [Oscillospiraceae bacterium]|nr:MFS transporter [Oscillospiraceae bacterium]
MGSYKYTVRACYIGYITQGIIVNFAPLLFLTFQSAFGLSMEQLTALITLNFLVQFTVDLLSAGVVDKIGYRPCMVAAHICAVVGLVGLAFFPSIMPPFAGLLTATVIYAVGGGLLEVMVSPIVEACPSDDKSAAMSILHSFYCWGVVAVVLISTLLFRILGIENWRWVACMWAVIPACNAVLFTKVPIAPIVSEGRGMTVRELLKTKLFWILFMLMVCSGAAELAVGQWASAFAESGLKVSKTVGDLAGPCLFAVCMGVGRVFYAKFSERIDLEKYITGCGVLCILSYIIAIVPLGPVVNLIGCGICGVAVAMVWPGMLSVAAARCPTGGTAMFALLALGGDIGCTSGPTVVGLVSGLFDDDLKIGFLAAIVFPLLLIAGMRMLKKQDKTA